jgi:PhnB protein
MGSKILAYVFYETSCKDAMEFYQKALGGEVQIQQIKDTPIADKFTPAQQDLVMHAELRLDGETVLMASDMMGDPVHSGNQYQLMVNCGSEEELRRYFDSLSKGGTVIADVRKEFWGAVYGQLKDKFGIEWMLNFNLPQKSPAQ